MTKYSIKIFLKQIIFQVITRTPLKIKNYITNEILKTNSKTDNSSLYIKVLDQLELKYAIASGDNGYFLGKLMDQGIFQKYIKTKHWSTQTLEIVKKQVNESTVNVTYIDVGANIGLTVIPIAKLEKITSCIAFEPEAENYNLLCINSILNGVSEKITTYNNAVSDSNGNLEIEISPNNFGDNRIRRANNISHMGENHWHTAKVESVKLDNFSFDHSEIVIKIDVQGAEPLVFAGGEAVLNSACLVIFEFSPYQISRMNLSPESIYKFIKDKPKVIIIKGDTEDVGITHNGNDSVEFLKILFDDNKSKPYDSYWDVVVKSS